MKGSGRTQAFLVQAAGIETNKRAIGTVGHEHATQGEGDGEGDGAVWGARTNRPRGPPSASARRSARAKAAPAEGRASGPLGQGC